MTRQEPNRQRRAVMRDPNQSTNISIDLSIDQYQFNRRNTAPQPKNPAFSRALDWTHVDLLHE